MNAAMLLHITVKDLQPDDNCVTLRPGSKGTGPYQLYYGNLTSDPEG